MTKTIECPDCGSTDVTRVRRYAANYLCHYCFATFVPGYNKDQVKRKKRTGTSNMSGIERIWHSNTGKASCELRLDGATESPVSIVFKNRTGQEVYWPYSDWQRLTDQIRASGKKLKQKQATP